MHDNNGNIAEADASTALFRLFPNYAGTAKNAFGKYPLSFMELNRPTGKYVSRFLLRELNLLTRKHSIVLLGNACIPGYFFPQLETGKGLEQFDRQLKTECGVFIANLAATQGKIPGTVTFEAEPFMLLDIPASWKSFKDYLAAMTSKYRLRVKKALDVSSHLEKIAMHGENLNESDYKIFTKLLTDTLKEKTLALNNDLGGILHRFAEHFGKNYRIFTYKINHVTIGFISCTIEGGVLTAWHVGYESGQAKDLHLYQRMLCDLVALGIKEKVKQINFGRTATEIKSTLGAKPFENDYVVFIKNGLVFQLVKLYRKYFYRKKEAVIRSPFKSTE